MPPLPPATIDPNALIQDVEVVKDWLNIPDTNNILDDFLIRLINRATGIIEKEVDRLLKKRVYVGDLKQFGSDGTDMDIIWLFQFPVISVEKVNLGFNSADLATDEFVVYPDGWIRLVTRPFRFVVAGVVPEGVQNINVDYTAGFDPVPDELVQACLDQIAHMYRRSPKASGGSRAGLESRSVGDTSENFIDDATIPPAVMQVLGNYRREEMVPHRNAPADSLIQP